MQYISTRGGMKPASFSDVVLMGLAPDGGLTLPESYPRFSRSELESFRRLDYSNLVFHILPKFIDGDIPPPDLEGIIGKTYTKENFGTEEIIPLEKIDHNLYLLDLSRGPTLAFKDVALQLLGNLFEYALKKKSTHINLLGATSGDTGPSAEEAIDGRDHMTIQILSPLGRMSHFQAAQMYRKKGENITNTAVEGTFDDCQDMVKALDKDPEFKAKYKLGTVNSINWARVAAQVVYYFKGYFAATDNNEQVVDFAVPTGNFGDILAGYIAKQMGLPIRHLYLATNENNVLEEFFRTGVYSPRSKTIHTSSPSMDITKASNFERFLFDMVGKDTQKLNKYMALVESGQPAKISERYWERVQNSGIIAGTSTHRGRLYIIRAFYEKYNRLVDPHTADGIKVGYENRDPDIPVIFLETAKPAKFEATIREAIGRPPEMPSWYDPGKDYKPDFVIKAGDINGLKRIITQRAIQ